MSRLTAEQQQSVIDLLPMVRRLARRWGAERDDELFGVANEALCVSVLRYKPRYRVSLKTFVWRKVYLALFRYVRRQKKQLPVDICFDISSVVDHDTTSLTDIFDRLPGCYRTLAYLRWVDKLNIREIAKRTGIPRRRVAAYLERAEGLALLACEDIPEL